MAMNMQQIWEDHKATVAALGLAVVTFMLSAFVVPEEEQVVIVRTGEPVGTIMPGFTSSAGAWRSATGCRRCTPGPASQAWC